MHEDTDRSGEIIDGRYRVGERLGQGGMGSIYRAEHLGLAQQRAIKFLRADLAKRPSERRRFLQEAMIVSRLHHPHIVEVFDVGDSGDTAYYVMELLVGEDLRARMRREGALAWGTVRTIARQICDALDAAHRGGVVHRDLKPENCFLVHRTDNSVLVKLLDFGVAKLTADSEGDRLTGTGETLGTVGYMAPEQLEGVAHPCVDVYALGVMLYEMLSGRPPHPGNPAQVIARLARGTPPVSLTDLCADLPVEFVTIVQRAMEHDPRDRYPDMHALARALDSLPEEALRAGPGRDFRVELVSPRSVGMAATGVDAHAPTASPPGSQGVVLPAAPITREQRLGQDFRTIVVITALAALVVVGATLWLVRPPSRGPATLHGELHQAVVRCRPIKGSGSLEINVASTANGELDFTVANPRALQVVDATCVQRELDKLRTSVVPADLGTTPLSIQIDLDALGEGR